MEIGKHFNTLTFDEYFFCIDNHKKYKDFNTLGLYRSLIEHEKLTLEERIAIRDYAHQHFKKTFDFLQLKDPKTFVDVTYLGAELTKGDEQAIWKEVRKNQQQILTDKRVKHRNFGDYAKHNCGYEDCVFNGMMIRQGSTLAESSMHFSGDKNKYQQKVKSTGKKAERKNEKNIIKNELAND